MTAGAEALPLLLRRLYVRWRARGLGVPDAGEQAAAQAAELLACDLELARAVLADLDLSGPHRPL